ncbi:MAG: hypothetical protein IKI45_13010 [Oscillospiraceae bacterium]|nr:hypothetical protein [Oscillospiraceae bacterium]
MHSIITFNRYSIIHTACTDHPAANHFLKSSRCRLNPVLTIPVSAGGSFLRL